MRKKVWQRAVVSVLIFTLTLGLADTSLFSGANITQAKQTAEDIQQNAADRIQAAKKTAPWSEQTEKRTQDATFWSRADGKHKVRLYTDEIRYAHPQTKKWVDYEPLFIADSTDGKNKNRPGYYENHRGDDTQSVPTYFHPDAPIQFENAGASLRLLPLDEQGEALRTQKTKTTAIKDTSTDPYGNETEGISEVSYTTKTGLTYRYRPRMDGLHETVVLPAHTKQRTLSYTLQSDQAYAEADGKPVTGKKSVQGKEIRMIGADQKPVGILPPISMIASDTGDRIGTGFYTIALTQEQKKGNRITRTYRLTMETALPTDSDIQGVPLHIESVLSVGESEAASAGESSSSLWTFDRLQEVLEGKYIQRANILVTETEQSPAGEEAAVYARTAPNEAASHAESVPVSRGAVEAVRPEGEPLGTLVTSGTAGTTQSVDVTEEVLAVLQGKKAHHGFQITAVSDAAEAEETASWWESEDSLDVSARPVLSVTYYDEPEAPRMDLQKIDYQKGEEIELTWREAAAPSLGFVQYRITPVTAGGKLSEKDLFGYSEATKMGEEKEGSFTIPTSQLKEGSYQIGVRSVDTQGNGGKENVTEIHLDKTKPQLQKVSLQPVTRPNQPGNQPPTLSWSGARDDRLAGVEYSVNGGRYVRAGESAQGSLTFGTVALTSETNNIIRVRAVDRAGNVSPEQRFSYYYDSTEPQIKSITLGPNSPEQHADQPAVVTYEIADAALKEVQYRVDRGAWKPIGKSGTGTYAMPASAFPITNVYVIEIQAIDRAGNTGYWASPYYYARNPEEIPPTLPTEPVQPEPTPSEITPSEITPSELTPSESAPSESTPYESTLSESAEREASVFTAAAAGLTELLSSALPESAPRVLAAAASATPAPNRLGKKGYLPYFDFSTGSGSGSVEETQGNLFFQMTAVTVPTSALSISIAPSYNSQSTEDQGMGAGWHLPYFSTMQTSGESTGGFVYQDETGAEYRMTQYHTATQAFKTPENSEISATGATHKNDNLSRLKEKGDLTYGYENAEGKLWNISEPNGDQLRFSYDYTLNKLKTIQTETDKVVSYHYETKAGKVRLLHILFPDQSKLVYHYNSTYTQMTSVTYEQGSKQILMGSFEYDTQNRITKIRDGNGNACVILYTGNQVQKVTQPNGDTTAFDYAASSTQIRTFREGVPQTSETVRYHQTRGVVWERIDALGLSIQYSYQEYLPISEAKEVVEQEIDASGEIITNTYHVTSTTQYDTKGNVTGERDEQGNTTAYEYTSTSSPSQDSPTGVETKDAAGVPVSQERTQYDDQGNETVSSEAISQTQTTTDRQENPASAAPSVAKVETVVSEDNALESSEVTSAYDADGNIVSEQEVAGETITYTENTYDAMGRVTRITEYRKANETAAGVAQQITEHVYDHLGRTTATSTRWLTTQQVETERKQYDANGNITQEVDKEGVTTVTVYDAMNRVTKKTVTHPGTTGASAQPAIDRETEYAYSYETIRVYDGIGGSKWVDKALKTETKTNETKDGELVKQSTEISYQNGLGQTVRTISAGIYTDYTFDAMGRSFSTYRMGTAPRATGGTVTCQLYDGAGNVKKTVVNPGKTQSGAVSEPTPTVAPSATQPPVPAGYTAMNLSNYRLTGGAAVYDAAQGLTVTKTSSVSFPLSRMGSPGDRISLIVQGQHHGTKDFQSLLADDVLGGVSNSVFGLSGASAATPSGSGFRWEYTLTATEEATHLLFKGANNSEDLDHLTITAIAWKYEPGSTESALTLTPAETARYQALGPGATVSRNTTEQAIQVKTAAYGQGVALKFTLPAGESLEQYSRLKYDIKLTGEEPVSWKQMRADALTSLTGYTSVTGTAEEATYGAGAYYSEDNPADSTWLTDQVIKARDSVSHQSKTGDVILVIGLNAGPADGGDAGGSSYLLRNIRLVKHQGTAGTPAPTLVPSRGSVNNSQNAYRKTLVNRAGKPTAYGTTSGTLRFADCAGYDSTADIAKFDRLEVKAILYSDAGGTKPLTDLSETSLSYTKICLNDTASAAYQYGYGDGYQHSYLNSLVPDAVNPATGEITVTFDLTRLTRDQQPQCITAQVGSTTDVGALRIVSLSFSNPVRVERRSATGLTTAEDSLVSSKEYDSLGNVSSETDEAGITTVYTYDSEKRVTEVSVNGGAQKRTYSYDQSINTTDNTVRTNTADAKGNQTSEVKNGAGQLLKTIDKEGTKEYVTSYEYDTSGNLRRQAYPNGTYISYVYNEKNLLVGKHQYKNAQAVRQTLYQYYDSGLLYTMLDYERDSSNRLTPYYIECYTYDSLGNPTSFASAQGVSQPTDPRLEEKKLTYEYDQENRLSRLIYPSGSRGIESQESEYDEWGRLVRVKGVNGSRKPTLQEYEYNENGDVKIVRSSSKYSSNNTPNIVKEYQYDELMRVSKIGYRKSASSQDDESFTYEYDKRSQIVSEIHQNNWSSQTSAHVKRTTAYEYNALNQLIRSEETAKTGTQAATQTENTYVYDKAGNCIEQVKNGVKTTFQYNGRNHVTLAKTGSTEYEYDYDTNGNLIYKQDSGGGTAYEYDVENQLTQATGYSDGTEVFHQTNQYNGNGQRIQKNSTFLKNNQYQQEDRQYFYNGSNLWSTVAEDTSVKEIRYFYGGEGDVLASYEYNSTGAVSASYGYIKDIRGSVRELVGQAGSQLVTYRYSDYGETSISGSATENELMYTGEVYDEVTGQYYQKARYYDPNIGRFLTQDSYKGEIREANTWNLYAYCHGNPINFIDPTGHDAIWLQQKSGAMGMGHTAVAIQLGKTNQWAYFSFSSATPSNIAKNLVGAKMKITNNRISLVTEIRERGKVVAKTSRKAQTNDLVNKVKKSKDGVTYDGTAYIEGDFSKGLSYLRRKKKEEKRLKYYLLGGGNCKDYVVTALSQGTKVKNNLYFRSSLNNANKAIKPNTAFQHMKNYENHKPVIRGR